MPDDVRESATGLGYGRTRLLFRIELPLALPVMMAGLRVATVSTVALTTVGSLVAYGGLGNLIKDGVNTNFRAELLTAAVLCVVLAVCLRRAHRAGPAAADAVDPGGARRDRSWPTPGPTSPTAPTGPATAACSSCSSSSCCSP